MSRETVELTVVATRENDVIDIEIVAEHGRGVRSSCSFRVNGDLEGRRRLLGMSLEGVVMTLLGAGETHDRR